VKNILNLYRGISDFKTGYQPRISTVKDEKGDLFTNSHSFFARWRNHFSQQLNVHGVNGVWRAEIHTAEPLVPKPSAFEVEMITEKLNRHKSSDVDQIQTGLKQGAEQFALRSLNLLILFGIRTNYLRSGRSEFIRRVMKQTVAYQFVNYIQNFIHHPAVKVNSISRRNS
jgi:hypothetical protein